MGSATCKRSKVSKYLVFEITPLLCQMLLRNVSVKAPGSDLLLVEDLTLSVGPLQHWTLKRQTIMKKIGARFSMRDFGRFLLISPLFWPHKTTLSKRIASTCINFHPFSFKFFKFNEKIPVKNSGPGERLLVVGPSGCGKTSVLRVASGLWDPEVGSVQRHGCSWKEKCREKYSQIYCDVYFLYILILWYYNIINMYMIWHSWPCMLYSAIITCTNI